MGELSKYTSLNIINCHFLNMPLERMSTKPLNANIGKNKKLHNALDHLTLEVPFWVGTLGNTLTPCHRAQRMENGIDLEAPM